MDVSDVLALPTFGPGAAQLRVSRVVPGPNADRPAAQALLDLLDRSAGDCSSLRGDFRLIGAMVDRGGAGRPLAACCRRVLCCPYHFGRALVTDHEVSPDAAAEVCYQLAEGWGVVLSRVRWAAGDSWAVETQFVF